MNHWSVGAQVAVSLRALEAAFAIEGHHTGLPPFLENDEPSGLEALGSRLSRVGDVLAAAEVNGFSESWEELWDLHKAENPAVAVAHQEHASARDFATALRTRMVFSSLVDADFLDTESHFDQASCMLVRTPAVRRSTSYALAER